MTESIQPELDWDAVVEELREYFHSNGNATLRGAKSQDAMLGKQALRTLVDDCDERIILQNLYLFCGEKPEAMKAVRKELKFKERSKTMLDISALLRDASSKIPIAEKLLADLNVTTHNMTPGTALGSYAALLEWAAKEYDELGNGRISGRDQHLVFLCRYIKRVTEQEHYREIADLVNATRDFYYAATAEDETYESIRKRISRHQGCHDAEIAATLETTKLRQPTAAKSRKSRTR